EETHWCTLLERGERQGILAAASVEGPPNALREPLPNRFGARNRRRKRVRAILHIRSLAACPNHRRAPLHPGPPSPSSLSGRGGSPTTVNRSCQRTDSSARR